jgi:hypothetical protein
MPIFLASLGFVNFELFGMILGHGGCGQALFELFISQYRRTPLSSCGGREIAAGGDFDDGLPRRLLAGAIVKIWVAHRLDWLGELLGRRGEELAGDVGSERRCLLANEDYDSRFSRYSEFKRFCLSNSRLTNEELLDL